MLGDKIIEILDNKKAIDIVKLDIKEKSTLADLFIVASGTSSTHVKSLCDNIEKDLKEKNIYPRRIEGYSTGRWILMDYNDVIVHIFHPDERELYDIESLWENSSKILNN